MRKYVIPLLLLLSLSGVSAFAQKSPELVLTQVNDRRSSGHFAALTLSAQIPSIPLVDVAASRVLLTSAVDDTGQDLLDPDRGEPMMQTNSRAMYMKDDRETGMILGIDMKVPSRKAKVIKEVRGEVELFMPKKDPNSAASISKFLSQEGKMLNHKALKANKVDIAVISKAQLEAEKKKAADAKRKEATAEGIPADVVEDIVKNFLEYYWKPEEGEVVLRVKDPEKRIQQVTFIPPSGEPQQAMMNDREGYVVLSSWGAKPERDWSLKIDLKTPKALVKIPFVLRDVKLP